MSHISKVACEIKDLGSLKKAVKRLNGTFKEGQKTFKMWGTNNPACEHAISFPNCSYEVGVVKGEKPNTFSLEADFYSVGGLTEIIGEDAGKLKQFYSVEVAKKNALLNNYSFTENTMKDGTIQLRMTVNG